MKILLVIYKRKFSVSCSTFRLERSNGFSEIPGLRRFSARMVRRESLASLIEKLKNKVTVRLDVR
jgi:hypothetical protein